MDINGAFGSAVAALQRADEGMQRSASTVARISAGLEQREDMAAALVDATTQQTLAQASVKVVNSVEETEATLGRLLDTRA